MSTLLLRMCSSSLCFLLFQFFLFDTHATSSQEITFVLNFSNATFQLPGLFSCHVFQDEEDSPINLFRDSAVKMSVEATSSLKELDTCAVMPKLHWIEKVVDELEMEDAILPKEDKGITRNNSDSSGSLEPTLTNPSELPPLPPVPPPPVDPPPPPVDPPPPLPPSPPPSPPPLPLSPSTPPPPPPPPLHPPGQTFMPSIPVPPVSSSYSFSMLNSQMQEEFRVSNVSLLMLSSAMLYVDYAFDFFHLLTGQRDGPYAW